jgi:hypothetical protein
VPVLTEYLQAEYAINAIYPHRHHLSAKVRSFIDLLAKHFRDDPAWADPCRSKLVARNANGAAAAQAPSPTDVERISVHQSPERQSAA